MAGAYDSFWPNHAVGDRTDERQQSIHPKLPKAFRGHGVRFRERARWARTGRNGRRSVLRVPANELPLLAPLRTSGDADLSAECGPKRNVRRPL